MPGLTMPPSLTGRLKIATNAEGLSCAGVEAEDFFIVDPYQSTCGRFDAKPADYGLTEEEGVFIAAINKAIEQATEDAINAGCLAVQTSLGVTAGDFAGVYFSGDAQRELVRSVFAIYALREAELSAP